MNKVKLSLGISKTCTSILKEVLDIFNQKRELVREFHIKIDLLNKTRKLRKCYILLIKVYEDMKTDYTLVPLQGSDLDNFLNNKISEIKELLVKLEVLDEKIREV